MAPAPRSDSRASSPDAESRAGLVFTALADGTRRQLLRAVVRRGPVTATALSADVAVTRQAVAKHLGVLRDAGLVRAERCGRETRYEAQPDSLRAASRWIDQTGAAWDQRLARLSDQVANRAGG
jgi:DNA-binding transcriptional ArsR family regulator